MNPRSIIVLCVSLALALLSSPARAEPGDEFSVSVLTMSPGDPVFFKFGHIALWVHDNQAHTDEVFNWGTFSFEEPGLVSKFLQGRLTYWLSVQSMRGTLRQYKSENRSILAQELNLSAEQKRAIVIAARENALPENAKYRYHYYRDNCSTRVRDIVDAHTGNALRAVSAGPARMTFRGQTSRLTQDSGWAYVFLNLAMGSYIDQPIAEWDEMFVPSKVQQLLRRATIVNAAGQRVPLVASERTLVTANRAPEPDAPPRWHLPLALIGSVCGSLLGWLAHRWLCAPRSPKASWKRRLPLALLVAPLGLLVGFLGCLFSFFWFLTDHEVAWRNENLLQCSPLALALLPIAFGILMDSKWARRAFVWIALALAAMSILGLMLKPMFWWFKQVNGQMIALCLPIWLGLATGPFLFWRSSRRNKAAQSAAS